MRKIHRQVKWVTMKPPSGGPNQRPTSAGMATSAMASTMRSFGTVRTRTRRPTGVIIEPPSPWSARAKTNSGSVCDRAQATEPTRNTRIAIWNTRRAPNLSATQPEIGMKIARLSIVGRHRDESVSGATPKSRAIAGSAVEMTVESIISMPIVAGDEEGNDAGAIDHRVRLEATAGGRATIEAGTEPDKERRCGRLVPALSKRQDDRLVVKSAVRPRRPAHGRPMPDSTRMPIAAALGPLAVGCGRRLAETIRRHAGTGAYAVFDMDNTLYRNRHRGGALPFLEARGIVTRETMDPSLAVVPFADKNGRRESLVGYYYRLCEIDDKVGYPWLAQIFAGLKVGDLAGHVAASWEATSRSSPPASPAGAGSRRRSTARRSSRRWSSSSRRCAPTTSPSTSSPPPTRNSPASSAAIPSMGSACRRENVIGVSTLLKDRAAGTVTTARKLMAEGLYHRTRCATRAHATLWTPTTWMSARSPRCGNISTCGARRVVVAGDSPASDGYMLLQNVDVEQGGQRIWVDRSPLHRSALETQWIAPNVARQAAPGEPVTRTAAGSSSPGGAVRRGPA